jgi:hypothetical protein
MGLVADIVYLFTQGYGWLFVILGLAYELFAPTWLNRDTALAPLVRDLPEDLQEVKEQQRKARKDITDISDEIDEVQRTNKIQMQVQRAQARANDDMDEDEVDSYLRQNGVTVDTFLQDDE